MKNLFLFLAFAAAFSASAYTFKVIHNKDHSEQLWSQIKWSLGSASEAPDNLKPSSSDTAIVSGSVVLDTDLSIGTFSITGNSSLKMDARSVEVKKNMSMNFSRSAAILKNGSSISVSGPFSSQMTFNSTAFDGGKIFLENSKFSVGGVFSIPLRGREISKKLDMGFSVIMSGSSEFKAAGFVLDKNLTDPDSKMYFLLSYENIGEKYPCVFIGSGDISGLRVDINFDGNLPKGKYTVFSTSDRKQNFSSLRIRINGKEYSSLGAKITEQKRTVFLESKRTSKAANLILNIK